MLVRVYAPPFGDAGAIDERGFVELSEGATLDDLLRRLRLPLRHMAARFCVVNYEKARPGAVLRDGDTVSFFAILPGG